MRWRAGRDVDARSQLVGRYSLWSRQVARSICLRLYGLGDAWDDCAQNALIGLIEAIDRYDPDRGVGFELYARHRVRGSVFNGLRHMRDRRMGALEDEGSLRVAERVSSLQAETEDPFEAFVATSIGLGIAFLLDASSVPESPGEADAYSVAERSEMTEIVSRGVEELPDRESLILRMHYYHHVPFVHIADQLGVTKGRVSQLHKRAIDRLREHLQARWVADA